MRESPRTRRLRTDRRALERLRAESTILDFSAPATCGDQLPESYSIRFRGRGLWRPNGTSDVLVRETHEVSIQLGAGYPRMMPELAWQTPIFHPNVSGNGIVCLGGYGTHWVPSLNLDELCIMLWDIVRYANFDVESPYNREAALWTKNQDRYRLPVDPRPLRDRLAGLAPQNADRRPPITTHPQPAVPKATDMMFLDEEEIIDAEIIDAEIVEPEIVEPEDPDILFIE